MDDLQTIKTESKKMRRTGREEQMGWEGRRKGAR